MWEIEIDIDMEHFSCEGALTLQKLKDWWDSTFGDWDGTAKVDEFSMSEKRLEEYKKIVYLPDGVYDMKFDPADIGRPKVKSAWDGIYRYRSAKIRVTSGK